MPEFAWAAGASLSSFGDDALVLVFALWIKHLTGSASAAAFAFLAYLAPAIFAPVAGLLADRLPRARLLIGNDLAQAALVSLALVVGGAGQVGLLYLVLFGIGLGASVQSAAASALVSELVPADRRGRLNSVFRTGEDVALCTSPLLGALLYGSVGPYAVIAIEIGTFGVSAAAVLQLRSRRRGAMAAATTATVPATSGATVSTAVTSTVTTSASAGTSVTADSAPATSTAATSATAGTSVTADSAAGATVPATSGATVSTATASATSGATGTSLAATTATVPATSPATVTGGTPAIPTVTGGTPAIPTATGGTAITPTATGASDTGAGPPGGRVLRELAAGVAHIVATQELRLLVGSVSLALLLFGMFEPVLLDIASTGPAHRASFAGVLLSLNSLGSVAGGALCVAISDRIGPARLVRLGLLVVAAGTIPLLAPRPSRPGRVA